MVLISLFFRIGVFLHVHPIDNRNSRYQFEVFCVWATLSILIKSCIYLPSPAFAYLISFPRIKTLSTFRQSKRKTSINMQTHRIVIDEEEFEEEDMALKPIKERLEMVDVDIKHEKKRIEDWNADCCK
jgi:hypothetical protein